MLRHLEIFTIIFLCDCLPFVPVYQAAGDVVVVKLILAAFPWGGLVAELCSEFLESECLEATAAIARLPLLLI